MSLLKKSAWLIGVIAMLNYDQYPLFCQHDRCIEGSCYPEDIKAAIRKTGVYSAELYKIASVCKISVSKALAESFTKGEVTIAEYLALPVQLLFSTCLTVHKGRVRPHYAAKYTMVTELLS